MKLAKCIKLIVTSIAILMLVGCAQNPVTGQPDFVMMSEQQEINTGKKGDVEIQKEYPRYKSPALQKYINDIGQKLARHSHRTHLTYHFTVVDSPEINAFALPGGYIYITRGMLAYLNSEAELASVLGHEIGHVTARHGVQSYSKAMGTSIAVGIASILVPQLQSVGAQNIVNLMGSAILAGYGRENELEADRLGSEYIAHAGYDPQAMINVIGVLKNQELFDAELAKQENRAPRAYHGVFASHPNNDDRLKQVVDEANKFTKPNTEDARLTYLKNIDGLIFGDSPEQGITRNNSFYHTDLGFALTLPPEWRVKNNPDQLLLISPTGNVMIRMFTDKPDGSPADLLRKNLNLNNAELAIDPINQLPAAIMSGEQNGKPMRIAAIYLNNKAYVIAARAESDKLFNQFENEINTTIKSFHKITDAERKIAKPLLIKTITAQPDTTYNKLAKNSAIGKNAENYLRLMNNAYPTGEPKPGQIIKIIE